MLGTDPAELELVDGTVRIAPIRRARCSSGTPRASCTGTRARCPRARRARLYEEAAFTPREVRAATRDDQINSSLLLRVRRRDRRRPDRPGHPGDLDGPRLVGARRRHRAQPAAARRAGARRADARARRGDVRGVHLRRVGPAHVRDVPRLPVPDQRRDRLRPPHRPRRHAVAADAARRQGLRRGVVDELPGGVRQRRGRRAGPAGVEITGSRCTARCCTSCSTRETDEETRTWH